MFQSSTHPNLKSSYHHDKHQGLDPSIRSVYRVTTALANFFSVFQLFSFLVVCSDMISKAFDLVAFFVSVKASSVCIYLSCLVCMYHTGLFVCCLFSDALSESDAMIVNTELGCLSKWTVMACAISDICLEILRRTTKDVRENSSWPLILCTFLLCVNVLMIRVLCI